jgi:integrase/recombinase XerD
MSVTTAIILDKRRMNKKTNNYSVVIRVTFNRIPRAFPIGMEMSEGEFKKLVDPKSVPHLGEKLREIKQKMEKEEQRAKSTIKNLYKFSFPAFKEAFCAFRPKGRKKASNRSLLLVGPGQQVSTAATASPVAKRTTGSAFQHSFKNQFGGRKYPRDKSEIDFQALGEVAIHYGVYIQKLEAQERIGTVGCYVSSLASLLNYHPQLRFSDITELELFRYEKWMKAKGNSVTTLSLYLRCLRHIFNVAIAKKLVDRDLYPFGPEKYIIPSGKNVKKAISIADIQRIYEYPSQDPTEKMCRDFWFFIYLGNGMNVKDLALLKYANIDGQFIRFIRAKTVNTSRVDPPLISVYCSEDVLALIDRWGNADKSPTNYIFPILSPGLDGYGMRHKIQLFTGLINDYMCSIGAALGIARKLTTMAARHSFSTQLKRSGASPEVIREMLGHNNLKTTMNYLDSFEDESKAEHAKNLLPFRKKLQAVTAAQE